MAQRSWKGPLLGVAGFLFMLLGTGYFAVSGMIVTISLDPGERTIIGEPPAGYAVTDQRMITTDGTDLSIWIVTGPATTGDRAIILVHGLGDQAWNETNRSWPRPMWTPALPSWRWICGATEYPVAKSWAWGGMNATTSAPQWIYC